MNLTSSGSLSLTVTIPSRSMVRHPRLRLGAILFLGFLLTSLQAFEETRDPWIRGLYTGNSPRPLACSENDAWRRAIDCVNRTPGAFVLVGTGASMQPLYTAGTLLVLKTCDYRTLQRGQTVVYRNQAQHAVGHVLIAKARDGWRAQGVNNRMHDMEPVRADNLIGVVVAAFQPQARGSLAAAKIDRAQARAFFLSDGGAR